MKKIITIFFLILSLIIFGIFLKINYGSNEVIEVISPTKLVVDLNNNKIADNNEIICVANIESFSKDYSEEFYKKYKKELALTNIDFINLGYLADEYAKKILLNKRIHINKTGKTTSECYYATIKIGNVKYKKLLENSGFAIFDGKISNKQKFKEKLEISKKLNLVIFNHKSNIYHKLDCKYGKAAHDKVLLPINQLPKDAKPCNFCINNKQYKKSSHKHNKQQNISYAEFNVNDIPPLKITTSGIELFLMDFAHKLKPDKNCSSQACQAVLENINSAKDSIDIAIYGYEGIPIITKSLVNAKNRGVKIRFVYDEASKPENTYYKANNIICELADKCTSDAHAKEVEHLMHNKFIIIDKAKVLTGSMNYSKTGTSGYDANDLIVISSEDIANLYEEEFEQMINGYFHNSKQKLNLKRIFSVDETQIEVFFSPKDRTASRISELIKQAKEYIYIPTFLITQNDITKELINAHNKGVDIRIVMDANSTSTLHTKYNNLRNTGIKLKFENYAGKMHTKTMIIDDKYLIMGSMNFSHSGNKYNDENTLIIYNPIIANAYKEYFKYLWTIIPDKYLKFNPPAESKESIGSCTDGVDNNFNGKIDLEEKLCQ